MDNSDTPDKNSATVIKPRVSGQPSAKSDPPKTVLKTGPSLDTGQARALTQIGRALKATDNSTGFEKARQAANQALKSNKIILNNRFVLDSIIGSGGMGTVYKARDLRKVEANDANPNIAIKVLNEDFQNHPDAFVTLQREASKSHILAHPNIVLVHDFDRDGAIIFMTMELLDGVDLESYIKSHFDRGVELTKAKKIIREFCEALIYAHTKNIIHSDLKPGNIFITKEGAKVLDFGISRISASAPTKDNFDAGSIGALTPAYASLEMIKGDPPDQSDDVYAVAIIAYELLSGKHPYQRKPADQALQENLKPTRLATLNKHQWHALESGLKLKRADRVASVQAFLNEFTYVRKNIILKVVALVLLVMTAVLGYYKFFAPNEVSAVVATTLKKASQCFDNKDYACAVESANAVLKLDPTNKLAKQLQQQAGAGSLQVQEQYYHAAALKCIDANDMDCARANLASIKQLLPQSALIAELQQKIEIKVAQTAAEGCFAEQRYDCAIENSNVILRIDSNNLFALNMHKQASELQSKNQQRAASNSKNYNDNMTAAEACFRNQDYDCSLRLAKQALGFKPNDREADALAQKASYAKLQRKEAIDKANQVLNEGAKCFQQKNYSCAIAKSESALTFVPNYPNAVELKRKAEEEISNLKKSIEIR